MIEERGQWERKEKGGRWTGKETGREREKKNLAGLGSDRVPKEVRLGVRLDQVDRGTQCPHGVPVLRASAPWFGKIVS